MKKILFVIFIFLLSQSLAFGENNRFRIMFTGSLNGKLEGCTCEKNPSSGLARRAYIINKYRKKFPELLLLDTGDNLADTFDPPLLSYTFKGLSRMNFDAMVFGDQDFYSGIEDFRKIQAKYRLPYLSNGVRTRDGKNFLTKEVITIKRGSEKIAILGYSDKSAFRYFPKKNQLNFRGLEELKSALNSIRKTHDFIILLSHSGIDIDKQIAGFKNAPDLLFSGHDQSLFKKPYYIKKTAIVSNGMNGYYIGYIIIKKRKIVKYRLIPVPFEKTSEDPAIKKIVNRYLKEKKDLFKF